ncbi:MAG: hypothetical protein ACI909_003187 [Planctomycetota bacterium]|jgi:uncharacterized protein (TIGR01244 family)
MEMTMKRLLLLCTLTTLMLSAHAEHERAVEKPVAGIRNLKVIDSMVACAGAITPETIPSIKNMGFVSIVNLRRPDEEGARIEEEAAAARSAGLTYVHIPFSSSDPDTAAVDEFLAAFTKPNMEPSFIHCAGGSRAAGMWYAKRAIVDGLDIDHAMEEAKSLGLGSETLQVFMTDYIESRR